MERCTNRHRYPCLFSRYRPRGWSDLSTSRNGLFHKAPGQVDKNSKAFYDILCMMEHQKGYFSGAISWTEALDWTTSDQWKCMPYHWRPFRRFEICLMLGQSQTFQRSSKFSWTGEHKWTSANSKSYWDARFRSRVCTPGSWIHSTACHCHYADWLSHQTRTRGIELSSCFLLFLPSVSYH